MKGHLDYKRDSSGWLAWCDKSWRPVRKVNTGRRIVFLCACGENVTKRFAPRLAA